MFQKPNSLNPVNANEEFCFVFRSKINNHYILYAAEIDGIDCNTHIDLQSQISTINPAECIELKTSRLIQNEYQDKNFKR